jgi:hypothetical protein
MVRKRRREQRDRYHRMKKSSAGCARIQWMSCCREGNGCRRRRKLRKSLEDGNEIKSKEMACIHVLKK